jgi:plasmid rolling circle replication initiator protein Rep
MDKDSKKNITSQNKVSDPLLDKLAQPSGFKNSLSKRARAKFITNAYTYRLSGLNSPLKKSYQGTYYNCATVLEQKDDKITGHYCNNRWCIVCNRIRTAKMIIGYKPQLDELQDKYFVTLTIPNVTGSDLRQVIKQMIKAFIHIKKTYHNQHKSIIGLRKLECTYNDSLNNYHPHFHIIVSGESVAHQLVIDWLKHYPEANEYAQDIRPADDNSVMELFKYFSKIVTNKTIYVQALDTIFNAMYGLRVYQAFGIKKVISEDISEIQAELYKDLEEREAVWTWLENDWIDQNTGELLTGYEPNDQIKKIINNIK